jgi:uncharacterized membrane protein YbhN (UPF0104 family)
MPERPSVSEISPKPLTLRTIIGGLAQLAVSVGLIVWVVRQVDLPGLEARLADIAAVPASLAVIAMLLQVCVGTYRWRRINAILGVEASFGCHWRGMMAGLFFGQLLPSTVGGDAYRIWVVARGAGLGFATGTLSVVSDRALGLSALLGLIGLTLPLLALLIGLSDAFWGLTLVVASGLVIFGLMVAYGRVPIWLSWLKIADALMAPALALKRILSVSGEFKIQLILGVGIHILSALTLLLLAVTFGVGLSPIDALVIMPPVILFSTLPISVAGWGVREGAMVAAFTLLGREGGDAVVLSVAFGLIMLLIGLLGGIVWGISKGRLR